MKNNQNRFLIRKSYLFRLINGRGGKNKKTLFQIILMLILFLKYIFIVKDPAFVKFFTKLATPDDQTMPQNTQLNTKGVTVKKCPCKHWPIC